jgi:glycine C-acetyltransferase
MGMEKFYTLKDFINLPNQDIFETADYFQEFIGQLDRENIRGYGLQSVNGIGTQMTVIDHYSKMPRQTISFVGNDYLGLSKHPSTIEAGIKAMNKYGTGACASPIIGGYLDIHRQLEKGIASFVSCEDALIYSAGFGANCGTLLALLNKGDIALMDMYIHASVIDGLYATNVKTLRHNDPDYLNRTLLEVKDKCRTKLVIVDGVYSQDGDIAPLPEYLDICRRHGAYLMVDDAHGIGVMGKTGRGTIEHFGLEGKVDIVTGTFSKSFGAVGGFVASTHNLIQYLKFYSRASTFSAAPAPSVTASVLKAIELIDLEPERRLNLWRNVQYLKDRLLEIGFDIGHSQSPIIPLMVRDDYKVKKAARLLLESGIYVIPIIYPGVKSKESRLRISILAMHTLADLDKLTDALVKVDKLIKIRPECVSL